MARVTIRNAGSTDLPQVACIQARSPESAQWDPQEYVQHDFTVAICEDHVAGFAVARHVAPGESEILNLAVDPRMRRRGVGSTLFHELRSRHRGAIFLEVRESNETARAFYQALGFQTVSVRPQYYNSPPESAIVMKFYSC